MLIGGEDSDKAAFKWIAEDRVESRDQRAVCTWLERRVEWGKVKARRISKGFHYLAALHKEQLE